MRVRIDGVHTFWSAGPAKRGRLLEALRGIGMEHLLPPETTDQAALREALRSIKGRNERIEPLKKPNKNGYQVTVVLRGEDQNDHVCSFTARVVNCTLEVKHGYVDTRRLQNAFMEAKATTLGPAVSATLRAVATALGGECLHPGHYWIPQDQAATWEAFASQVEEVTGGKVYRLQYVMDEEGVRALRDALIENMAKEAADLTERVCKEPAGEHNMQGRKEAVERLASRVERHREILGEWAEQMDGLVRVMRAKLVETVMQDMADLTI